MKHLDTSSASSTNGFPPKQGTWDFLQSAYNEQIRSICRGLIGPTYVSNKFYVIHGCDIFASGSGASQFWGIDSGWIFYNNELFEVDSFGDLYGAYYSTGIDVAIVVSNYTTNADPVQFSGGGSPVNVHNIRKLVFSVQSSATSGSVWFDLVNLPPLVYVKTSGQIVPTYAGSFLDNASNPVRFYKTLDLVTIEGRTFTSPSTTLTTDTTVFILPPGYRPKTEYNASVFSASDPKFTLLRILADGSVIIRASVSGMSCQSSGVYLNATFRVVN